MERMTWMFNNVKGGENWSLQFRKIKCPCQSFYLVLLSFFDQNLKEIEKQIF